MESLVLATFGTDAALASAAAVVCAAVGVIDLLDFMSAREGLV